MNDCSYYYYSCIFLRGEEIVSSSGSVERGGIGIVIGMSVRERERGMEA